MKQHKVHRFVDSYIKCIGLIRDPSGRGSIIEFSALHGLLDGDQIYLEVQWDEPMLKAILGKSQIQIEEIRNMYTNVHVVRYNCYLYF